MAKELRNQQFFVRIQMLRDEFKNVPRERFEEKIEQMLAHKKAILEEFRLNQKRKAFSDFLRTKQVEFVDNYEELSPEKKTQLIREYLQEMEPVLGARRLFRRLKPRGRARASQLAQGRSGQARDRDNPSF